jgi:hypothetical protein
MTDDKLIALRRMVKDRTNIEESRNALLQLLKRNAIEPEEVMEFVEAYQEHKALKQPIALPNEIRFFVAISYEGIRSAIEKGYQYLPMTRFADYPSTTDDEVFEIVLPLKGRKQITGKQL